MANSSSTGFFKLVGQLAIVAGLVWTFIQIYDHITKKEAKLTAKSKYVVWRVPTKLTNGYHDYDAAGTIFDSQLSLALAEAKTPPELKNKLETILKEKVQPRNEALKNLLEISGYRHVVINNDGDKEAAGIKVSLPSQKGFYTLNGKIDNDALKTFEDSIDIGSIRPQDSISIDCWLTGYTSEEMSQLIRVSTPEGVITPSFNDVDESTEMVHTIIDYIRNIFIIVIILIGGIMIGLSMRKKDRPKKAPEIPINPS